MEQVLKNEAYEIQFDNLNYRIDRIEATADVVIELRTVVVGLNDTLKDINSNMTKMNSELINVSNKSEDHSRRLGVLEEQTQKAINRDSISVTEITKDIIIKTIIPVAIMFFLAKGGFL